MVESNRLLIYRTNFVPRVRIPVSPLLKFKIHKTLTDIKFLLTLSLGLIFGIVVQLVRAPPCHGGSCEFKSRQSRFINQIKIEKLVEQLFNNNIRSIIIK